MKTDLMNQKVKELWVKALRSGEYQQGKEHLRKDGQYCCLGVLCDLAIKAGLLYGVDWIDGYPPSVVSIWANLDFDAQAGLIDMNDGGSTFEQIALAIENGL